MNGSNIPIVKDIVLIGGGHTHVAVLRRFGMKPIPGVRLTLVSPDPYTPYSGMLPGFIAGHYSFDDIHIDLAVLARFAGARLFVDEVTGIVLDAKLVNCANRPAIPYDLVSINAGSTPNTADIPGAAEHTVPVKPISRFASHWARLQERVRPHEDGLRIGVVGGGAGGVELMLAIAHRLQNEANHAFCLVTEEPDLLIGHSHDAARRVRRHLERIGVQIHTRFHVTEVRPGELHDGSGGTIALDEILWVTQAAAPPWLRESGLAVDQRGFLQIDDCLRSTSHDTVFGAGDAAVAVNHPRPKSGVFAVRQGRPLARNLRRAVLGRTPRPFAPQRRFLSLISTGPQHAIASRANWALEGRWAWRWKDWIDRRFMRRFNDLPAMPEPTPLQLPAGLDTVQVRAAVRASAMRCGGCGAKIPAPVLARVVAKINGIRRNDVLIGLDCPDDAAVVTVPPGMVLVQTVDSFRSMVDDPYLFGKITAHHCLNDIYAMGGEPQTALAIVTIPFGLELRIEDTLTQLLTGAGEVLCEAGAQLIGGHSGEGAELTLGFSVNGLAEETRLLRKSDLRPGQRLILTKGVGTGTLFAAEMRGKAKGRWIAGAIASMLKSNREAAACLMRHGATACTDVTGFGLAGHLAEMVKSGEVSVVLDADAVPALEGAGESLAAGIESSLQASNAAQGKATTNLDGIDTNDRRIQLLFDPQTAGGLLAGVPDHRGDACLAELRALGYSDSAVIGSVRPGNGSARPVAVKL